MAEKQVLIKELSSIYLLLIFYLSSTYPLLIFYLSSTFWLDESICLVTIYLLAISLINYYLYKVSGESIAW